MPLPNLSVVSTQPFRRSCGTSEAGNTRPCGASVSWNIHTSGCSASPEFGFLSNANTTLLFPLRHFSPKQKSVPIQARLLVHRVGVNNVPALFAQDAQRLERTGEAFARDHLVALIVELGKDPLSFFIRQKHS